MNDRFLTGNIWQSVATLLKKKCKYAAIAYVTSDSNITFGKGDILICDASDQAIKCGETSAAVLKRFLKSGAELYSCSGLHAKTLVTDDFAVLGSSNLSASSASNLIEAAIATWRFEQRSQIRAFIQELANISIPIDSAFVARISRIPVIQRKRHGTASKRLQNDRTANTWIVSTIPLSSTIEDRESDLAEVGYNEAKARITDLEDVSSIRWTGRSRFRSEAKVGDTIIELERNSKKNRCNVIQPRPIIFRQDHTNWTRFYISTPDSYRYYAWTRFQTELRDLGIKNISVKTNRLLTKEEVLLMDRFWNEK